MENPGLGPKKWLAGMVTALTLLFLSGTYAGAYPTLAPVANDLWDVSQGIAIGNLSSIHGNSLKGYMFGQGYDNVHPADPTGPAAVRGLYQATVFGDNYPTNPSPDLNKHFIEWTTANPVTVDNFNLFGYSDTGGLGRRSFDSFTLRAKLNSGDAWTEIYSCTISAIQYAATNDADWGGIVYWLSLSDNVDTIMQAQYFRAEFHGHYGGWGPRVVELDAFAAPIPIPGAVWLLGSGLLGLAGLRRFRKS
jgi:hypothetical protein